MREQNEDMNSELDSTEWRLFTLPGVALRRPASSGVTRRRSALFVRNRRRFFVALFSIEIPFFDP